MNRCDHRTSTRMPAPRLPVRLRRRELFRHKALANRRGSNEIIKISPKPALRVGRKGNWLLTSGEVEILKILTKEHPFKTMSGM